MKEEVKKLIEKVSNDTELKNKLKNAKDVNEILSITKDAGFIFTEEDLKLAKEEFNGSGEISSSELEKVSGGGGCGCFVGGHGEGSNSTGDFYCECVGAGVGSYKDFKDADEGLCVCPMAGAGASNSGGC